MADEDTAQEIEGHPKQKEGGNWDGGRKPGQKSDSKASMWETWKRGNLFGRLFRRTGSELGLHGGHILGSQVICEFRLERLLEIMRGLLSPRHLSALLTGRDKKTGVTKLKMHTGAEGRGDWRPSYRTRASEKARMSWQRRKGREGTATLHGDAAGCCDRIHGGARGQE